MESIGYLLCQRCPLPCSLGIGACAVPTDHRYSGGGLAARQQRSRRCGRVRGPPPDALPGPPGRSHRCGPCGRQNRPLPGRVPSPPVAGVPHAPSARSCAAKRPPHRGVLAVHRARRPAQSHRPRCGSGADGTPRIRHRQPGHAFSKDALRAALVPTDKAAHPQVDRDRTATAGQIA